MIKGCYIRTKEHRVLMSRIKSINNPLKGKKFPFKPKKLNIKKEVLVELYHNKDESLSQIAKRFNTSSSAILYHMKHHNIPRRTLKQTQKGEKNGNFRNWISRDPYGKEFNEELKEQIRKRDKYACQECNYTQEQLGYKLHIHHIDYIKTHNEEINLISLCRNCHMQTNFNRNDWTRYYKNK
jgi:predicted DNA-binding protein YlxM (UPF0122 family)